MYIEIKIRINVLIIFLLRNKTYLYISPKLIILNIDSLSLI